LLVTCRRIFAPAVLAALLVALLVFAPAAPAVPTPIGEGKTELRLSGGLYKQLKRNDVDVLRSQAGKVRGRVATLPVEEGTLDPVTGAGSVLYGGGIRFRVGDKQVALSGLVLNTTRRTLRGKIAGRGLKLASARGVVNYRNGFGRDLIVKRLKLTARAAKVLNSQLGLSRVFRGGSSLGETVGFADPASVTIQSGSIVLEGSEGFFGKLKSLDVEVVPFEAATVLGTTPPAFSFPLLPGTVPMDLSDDGPGSETGLRLIQKGGTPELPIMSPVMSLVAVSVSPESRILSAGVSVHFSEGNPGLYGVAPIATLDASTSALLADPPSRTLSMINLRATINQFLAEKLNETFAQPKGKPPLFSAGEPLGTVSLTVQAE